MCDAADCGGDGVKVFQSTAGRVDNAAVDNKAFKSVTGSITVGSYDPADVPAVNIFGGVGCTGASARLYSSADADADARVAEYGKSRVEVVAARARPAGPTVPAKFAQSAMVPHGYTLSVYAENNFKAEIDTVRGGLEDNGGGRNICHDFKLTADEKRKKAKQVQSLRIIRNKAGKIVTYWKSVTASETTTSAFTVKLKASNESTGTES